VLPVWSCLMVRSTPLVAMTDSPSLTRYHSVSMLLELLVAGIAYFCDTLISGFANSPASSDSV